MAQEFSFDVVSKVDLQEVSNAVQQASKEIATRFDFRGSKSKVEWNDKDLELTLIEAILEQLREQMLILGQRDHAVPDVTWREHLEVFAQPAG